MLLINQPRAAGKTTAAMKYAAEHNLGVITFSEIEAKRLRQLSESLSPQVPFIKTWANYIQNRLIGYKVDGVVVDNLDLCLANTRLMQIKLVTMTEQTEEKSNASN
jgi:hypothetical protein